MRQSKSSSICRSIRIFTFHSIFVCPVAIFFLTLHVQQLKSYMLCRICCCFNIVQYTIQYRHSIVMDPNSMPMALTLLPLCTHMLSSSLSSPAPSLSWWCHTHATPGVFDCYVLNSNPPFWLSRRADFVTGSKPTLDQMGQVLQPTCPKTLLT